MIYVQQSITEFLYTNIVETVLAFDPTTEYLVGDKCRVGSYHYVSTYGTLTLPNVGKEPLTNLGVAWIKLESEPSNIYACLDPFSETKTVWEEDGIVEFSSTGKDVLGLGNFLASQVIIEYLTIDDEVLDTQPYNYSNNVNVYDEWTYGLPDFTSEGQNTIYLPFKFMGAKIRVTFKNNGQPTECGFMIAGTSVYMGDTLNGVSFPDKRIGSKTIPVADFNTIVDDTDLTIKITEAKKLVNETMLFVIDESENSRHGNMIFVGKITNVNGTVTVSTKNTITWQIEQTILQ